jgi:hypothetical protein
LITKILLAKIAIAVHWGVCLPKKEVRGVAAESVGGESGTEGTEGLAAIRLDDICAEVYAVAGVGAFIPKASGNRGIPTISCRLRMREKQ